jgi:tetratricopeptide (TPR) repeat protein
MGRSNAVPILLVTLVLPAIAQTNKTQPARVRDGTASVTVSADIPKEQLRIEDECNAKLEDGKTHLVADPQKAIPLLQQALAIAEKHDYLKLQRTEALEALGQAHSVLGNSTEATKAFRQSLQLYGAPCEQNSRDPAACGEEEMNEAVGKWKDTDAASTASALVLARAARADFRRQQELDKSNTAVAAHKAKEAEALLIASILLAASGRQDQGRSAATDAIVLLRQVLSADIPADLRGQAERSLDWAKEILEKISGPTIR